MKAALLMALAAQVPRANPPTLPPPAPLHVPAARLAAAQAAVNEQAARDEPETA